MAENRDKIMRVRTNGQERHAFDQAAELAGLTLSAWARMVMRERAVQTLGKKESGL